MNVLVVDDEPAIVRIWSRIFRRFNVDFFSANDGESGFAAFQEHKPDLVLTDLRMPGSDGLYLIRKIRETGDMRPMLFVCTGYADDSREALASLKIIRIINKPFNARAESKYFSKVIEEFKANN